jgi:endoglucanase
VNDTPGNISTLPKGCQSNEVWSGTECLERPAVKVNTIGYLVGRAKRATVPAGDASTFALADAKSDEVVFEGDLGAVTQNVDSADKTRVADFSSFETPGTYVLRVDGLSDSPKFVISDDSLNEPLRVTMLGLYGQRCGVAVEIPHQGKTFKHAACHLHDALLGDKEVDGTGGWHDAGDYGKYTVNAAFALAFLLKAWEDFGSGLATLNHLGDGEGALPPWLDESRFQLDQILKMQLADGSAVHMLGPYSPTGKASFPVMIAPEVDLEPRAFSGFGTAATADLVAIAAMGARVFRSIDPAYADTCLAAAQRGQAFLEQNPTNVSPDLSHFTHNAYGTQDADDRFWAKVELWRTTGDAALLSQVEASLRGNVVNNFDWSNVDNLGMFSYVQATSDARDPVKLAAARQAVLTSADTLATGAAEHGYGRSLREMYYWGINGVLARATLNLFVANSISPDPKYLDAAIQQIDHLLGRNPFGRSFVTGLGYLPALHPHHRPSEGDSIPLPWPGLLVGGPNPNQEPEKSNYPTLAKGLFWFDDAGNYNTNEIAINWNTALAYALAGFYR